MTRTEFEDLRKTTGKHFEGMLKFSPDPNHPGSYVASGVIRCSDGTAATAYLRYNDITLSKTINIVMAGVGPICRLDVDGSIHKDAGRNHKHELRTPGCSANNLPTAVPRPELAGFTIDQVISIFCVDAGISIPKIVHR